MFERAAHAASLAGGLHLLAEGVKLLLLQFCHHAVEGVNLRDGWGERGDGGGEFGPSVAVVPPLGSLTSARCLCFSSC